MASASIRRARPLLGTFVEIAAAGAGCDLDAALESAFAAVEKVHNLMSFHDPLSDVSRINRDAVDEAVAVDAWTHEVVAVAVDLHRRSNGMFDVTVAPALQRLGLLPDLGEPPSEGPSPSEAIELLSGHRVRLCHPGTRLDLGGIAKGFAVDRAIETLRAHGITRGLVNAGGDLAAFGSDGETVHIRDPHDARWSVARVAIMDEALASSGGRLDLLGSTGMSASAVIDARTGEPARAIGGATVRAPTCVIADALTKVVMVAGEAACELLDHFGASALLVLPDGDIRITPSWRKSHAA